jgi:eukaryotic-like serine/threonine-protein kinase
VLLLAKWASVHYNVRLMTNSPPQHRNDPRRLIGRTFGGRYRVEELLGKGGMSAVYRAKHTRLGKTVALKILLGDNPNDDKQVARFTQEARACSRLKHPNIIKVFDYGQLDDGQLFISMELLLGRTMAKMVKDDGPQR